MKCLLRYPGGKSRMLKVIGPYLQAMLQDEGEYAEPYVGGGSVALYVAALKPKIKIVVNDKDVLVAGLWRVLAGEKAGVEALIDRLNVQPTVEMWDEVKGLIPKTDLDRAFKTVFLNRTSYNGMIHGSSPIGGRSQKGRPGSNRVWKIDCQYSPRQLGLLALRYNELLKYRTTVCCVDGLAFIQSYSRVPLYLDPPYFVETGLAKSLYGILMSFDEHKAVAQALMSARRWLMTYDFSSPVAKKLYWEALSTGAGMQVIPVKYSSTTAGLRRWKKDVELLGIKGFKA